MWCVIGIMIGAGVAGALVNMALNESARRECAWTLVAGIGASVLIPLFLRTVSSQLLSGIIESTSKTLHEDYFVFFGFCLLAAISSRAFIQTLSKKVLDSLKEGQEKLKQGQEKLEKEQRETKDEIDLANELARESITKSGDAALMAKTAATVGVRAKSARSLVRDMPLTALKIEKGTVPDDPWQGVFGGHSESNGRRLEATITPMVSEDEWCRVSLRVLSVDPAKPLSGAVKFFLHPTFSNDEVVVNVDEERQVAELTLAAWGAFTVGALADGGETKLELDLAKDPQAPEWFKEA